MTKQEVKEFIEWLLEDTTEIGVGIKEYLETEQNPLKIEIATTIMSWLKKAK